MKNLLAKTILLFHVVIVAFWLSLLLVPENLFPGKISFQFYLSLLIVGHQFLWGFVILPWTEKYRMVCFLTTITQLIRGEKISDPKNYDHSFTREILKLVGIDIPHRVSVILSLSVLTIVSIQYFF